MKAPDPLPELGVQYRPLIPAEDCLQGEGLNTRPDATEEQLQGLLDEQAALRRVATLVARNPEPSQVYARVCAEVGPLFGVESVILVRFEGPGKGRAVGAWVSRGTPVVPVGDEIRLEGDTAVSNLRRSGRPERADDYSQAAGPLPELLRERGIASSVAAPITVAGSLWGALAASSERPYSFPADTEQRIAGFAELVADAVANVDARQQLAASRARIVEAADAERRRLERNLHDGAQQRLVSLALALRSIRSELDPDAAEAQRRLVAAESQLEMALGELRELARGIHPAILTDRGLGAALSALAAGAPLPVELASVPAERLPPPVEAAAYYLVAEGVTNAAKHSQATAVTVRISRADGQVGIEIADDGIGGASADDVGGGLCGLIDRVEALGGHLAVESPPDRGTRLVANIPIDAHAELARAGTGA